MGLCWWTHIPIIHLVTQCDPLGFNIPPLWDGSVTHILPSFRLAAASNIIVITPFFFYSKGDQKDGYRVPITSKLVGAMLKKAGATHLMMLDPHTPQVEGFFDLIVDMLKVIQLINYSLPILLVMFDHSLLHFAWKTLFTIAGNWTLGGVKCFLSAA